jgi:hypothetical protein
MMRYLLQLLNLYKSYQIELMNLSQNFNEFYWYNKKRIKSNGTKSIL